LAQQTAAATLKEKEQVCKEVQRLKAEVALGEREVAAKKSEANISLQEQRKLSEELSFTKSELAATLVQKVRALYIFTTELFTTDIFYYACARRS
jgi:hypothetical protein